MTAALEGGEWSAARPGRTLPPGKTRYPFTGGWVGPRAGLDGRKISPHRIFFLHRDFLLFTNLTRSYISYGGLWHSTFYPGILDARIIMYKFVASCGGTNMFSYLSITTHTTVRYIQRLIPNTKDLLHFGTNTWYYQAITANTFHIVCFRKENDLKSNTSTSLQQVLYILSIDRYTFTPVHTYPP